MKGDETMKYLLKIILLFSVFLALSLTANTAFTHETKWIDGANKSCYQVCHQKGYKPFAAGTYKNGEKFYVCGANAGGEGGRPGYNLPPSWDNHCWVGHGGKEKKYSKYKCLCYRN